MDIFIGRQPIFNLHEEVVAYELLYRNENVNAYFGTDADAATIDVLVNSFFSIGFNEVTHGLPGFVNFTDSLLMNPIIEVLDPNSIVIELLEDVAITKELINRVIELKSSGFIIALDDFILNKDVDLYDELFAHTDIIKVDFLNTSLFERLEIEKRVKSSYSHIKLLAEKVETRNHFDVAKYAGYSLFQGYFFEQPQILKSKEIPVNTIQYFQIMTLLRDDEPNINQIAENIERDISLTYKLLQIINNSGKRPTSKKVRSIKQAIILLGLTELRKYLYLLAMRESGLSADSDVYKEIMYSSLFRAKICELLAKRQKKENYSEYFLVGMFSMIDSLLQRPIKSIINQLPFSEEVIITICNGETEMTPYLKFSIALNKLDWTKINEYRLLFDLTEDEMERLYVEATQWAQNSL